MPIYVYEVVLPEDRPGETFEILQGINDPPLTHHPDTGQPVRRVITAATIAGKWSDAGMKSTLSDRNLAAKGFTKYVKSGDGTYEKSVGSGPDTLGGG